jgi:hypothetical protein
MWHSGKRHEWLLERALMEAQSLNQNLVLFPNHFVPIFLEFKHTIAFCYETQHSLTLQGHMQSPKSLGYGPNCCKYFGSHGSTMYVEPKLRLLASFLCLYCAHIICMSNIGVGFLDT